MANEDITRMIQGLYHTESDFDADKKESAHPARPDKPVALKQEPLPQETDDLHEHLKASLRQLYVSDLPLAKEKPDNIEEDTTEIEAITPYVEEAFDRIANNLGGKDPEEFMYELAQELRAKELGDLTDEEQEFLKVQGNLFSEVERAIIEAPSRQEALGLYSMFAEMEVLPQTLEHKRTLVEKWQENQERIILSLASPAARPEETSVIEQKPEIKEQGAMTELYNSRSLRVRAEMDVIGANLLAVAISGQAALQEIGAANNEDKRAALDRALLQEDLDAANPYVAEIGEILDQGPSLTEPDIEKLEHLLNIYSGLLAQKEVMLREIYQSEEPLQELFQAIFDERLDVSAEELERIDAAIDERDIELTMRESHDFETETELAKLWDAGNPAKTRRQRRRKAVQDMLTRTRKRQALGQEDGQRRISPETLTPSITQSLKEAEIAAQEKTGQDEELDRALEEFGITWDHLVEDDEKLHELMGELPYWQAAELEDRVEERRLGKERREIQRKIAAKIVEVKKVFREMKTSFTLLLRPHWETAHWEVRTLPLPHEMKILADCSAKMRETRALMIDLDALGKRDRKKPLALEREIPSQPLVMSIEDHATAKDVMALEDKPEQALFPAESLRDTRQIPTSALINLVARLRDFREFHADIKRRLSEQEHEGIRHLERTLLSLGRKNTIQHTVYRSLRNEYLDLEDKILGGSEEMRDRWTNWRQERNQNRERARQERRHNRQKAA